MSLTAEGKISIKLGVESGTSKAGKEWKKQSFILDTGSQYNPEICFQLFGDDKISLLEQYNIGDQVRVSFNLSSKEWNGRYFHNVDAWKLEKMDTENSNHEDLGEPPVFDAPASTEDDLPF